MQQLGDLTDLNLSAVTWDCFFFSLFSTSKQAQPLFGSVLLFLSTWLHLEVFTCRLHPQHARLHAQQHVQAGQLRCNDHLFSKRERERSALMPEGFIPLSSPCMCRAPFPGLHASAFDPVSWAWLSSTGHHESLGSGFSAGSAGKKPGPQREVRPKNSNPCPLGREDRLLIRAYQAVVGYMDSGL